MTRSTGDKTSHYRRLRGSDSKKGCHSSRRGFTESSDPRPDAPIQSPSSPERRLVIHGYDGNYGAKVSVYNIVDAEDLSIAKELLEKPMETSETVTETVTTAGQWETEGYSRVNVISDLGPDNTRRNSQL
jgi:hypothetical protein